MKSVSILFFSVFAVSSFGKITIYSHHGALGAALASKVLTTALANPPLQGLELLKAEISSKGAGLDRVFSLELQYSHYPVGFRTCNVPVEIRVERDPKAPAGVTASRLSEPTIGEVECAN